MASVYMFIGLLLTGLITTIRGGAQTQTLKIINLGADTGKVYIAWYNDPASFRKPGKAIFSRMVETKGQDSVSVVFEKIPEGVYAVAVFFDRNNNGKIDTNMLGIPKEKYGFSNNVYPFARAASFKEAAFKIDGQFSSRTIRLR